MDEPVVEQSDVSGVRRSSRPRKVTEASKRVALAIRGGSAVNQEDSEAPKNENEPVMKSDENPKHMKRRGRPKKMRDEACPASMIEKRSKPKDGTTKPSAASNLSVKVDAKEATENTAGGTIGLHQDLPEREFSTEAQVAEGNMSLAPPSVELSNSLLATSAKIRASASSSTSAAMVTPYILSLSVSRKRARKVDEYGETMHQLVRSLSTIPCGGQHFWSSLRPKDREQPTYAENLDDDEMSELNFDDDYLYSQMTLGRAMGEFGIPRDVLDTMPQRLVPNPHYRGAAPMRLFVVKNLLKARKFLSYQKDRENFSLVDQRMNQLRDSLTKKDMPDIDRLHALDPICLRYALGDFCSLVKKPSHTLSAVKKRVIGLCAMHQFLPKKLHKCSLVDLFAQRLPRSSRDARAYIVDALDVNKKFMCALPIIADHIVNHLDSNDQVELQGFVQGTKARDAEFAVKTAIANQNVGKNPNLY